MKLFGIDNKYIRIYTNKVYIRVAKHWRILLLPVNEIYILTGKDGKDYIVEIEIYETKNFAMFSEGVTATFRLFAIDENGAKKLIYLIDNHEPLGFHEHDELPDNHHSRNQLHVKNWQDAWRIFQAKFREKL